MRRYMIVLAVALAALGCSYATANNAAHSGDRLIKADDAAAALLYTGASDFTDGADTATEYAYDPDGRLKSDANRGITSIDYNLICRPQEIIFSDESKMQMTYTASGELLQRAELEKFGLTTPAFPPRPSFRLKEYVTRRTITHYGQLTKDGGLYPRIETDYGYIRGDSTFYYIADYQGNNRQVVLGADASVVQENHYYPYGGLFGESSAAALLHINGTTANAYKYGGKEHLTMAGINMLDYGPRYHDYSTCQFTANDNKQEDYYSVNAHLYCLGDPINHTDPTGENVAILVLESDAWIGHMAMLIQDEDGKWRYYSVNGIGVHTWTLGTMGLPYNNISDGAWNSVQDFLDSDFNSKTGGENDYDRSIAHYDYTEAYEITTTHEEDQKMKSEFESIANYEEYDLLGNNCAHAVQRSLNAAGIKIKKVEESIDKNQTSKYAVRPTDAYNNIKSVNSGRIIKRSKKSKK